MESDVYSCLESMFDEDEARGLAVDPAGGGGGSINNNTNGDGDSSNSGKGAAAAAEQDKGKGKANGHGKDPGGPATPAASGGKREKVCAAAQPFRALCVDVKPFPHAREYTHTAS